MKFIIIFILGTFLFANGFEYVGSNKCKTCHKSEKKGAQYKKWEDTAHANTYDVLKTDKATEIAKAKGLKVPAYEAPECVKCHTTGFGKGGYEIKDDAFWTQVTDKGKPTKAVKRMTGLQAVGCEVCHGPGSEYKSKKKMAGVYQGTIEAESVGLLTATETTCLGCHNEESPSFKDFVFEERLKEISHPYPEDMKK